MKDGSDKLLYSVFSTYRFLVGGLLGLAGKDRSSSETLLSKRLGPARQTAGVSWKQDCLSPILVTVSDQDTWVIRSPQALRPQATAWLDPQAARSYSV